MPEVSPKTVALIAVPMVGAGFGVTFVVMKLKQRIITLASDRTSVAVCVPEQTYANFSGTVTDGFGRPVAQETVTVYADGQEVPSAPGQPPIKTDMNGNFAFRIVWSSGGEHINQSGSATISITACVGKYCSPPVPINVSWTACSQC
jgi:hypothetical protein